MLIYKKSINMAQEMHIVLFEKGFVAHWVFKKFILFKENK